MGAGFAPGDESYAEPYFYVTPWPYPDVAELLPLSGGGRWHTEGWVGAVLTSTELVGLGDAAAQRRGAGDFLTEAVEASRHLLS